MKQRDHLFYERYVATQEATNLKVAAEKQKTEEKKQEREDFYDALNKYREQRELKQSELRRFSESVYNNYMETALNAIYISALQQVAPLSEESIILAEKNTANYIEEHDGARNIIRANKGKTSLLDTIFEAVSTAANKDIADFMELREAEEKEEEEEKKEAEDKKKEDEKDPAEGDENASGEDIKVGDVDNDGEDDAEELDKKDPITDEEDTKETLDDDKPKEDDEKEKEDDKEEEKEEESKEDDKEEKNFTDELDKDDDPSDDEKSDDKEGEDSEEEKSEEEPEVDDGFGDADDSNEDSGEEGSDVEEEEEDEGPDEETFDDDGGLKTNKEEMFKKLENDAEVTDAVDIIAKRISDAESEFIQKNAEDKKKIEQIVNKVDDRIKAVTDSDKAPEEKEQEAEEAQQEATRLITDIKEQRFHSVFEELVKDNFDYIMKDDVLKESYTDLDGTINVAQIVESSRVMYGFLEFVNTIQLEKVNSEYILKVIKNQI